MAQQPAKPAAKPQTAVAVKQTAAVVEVPDYILEAETMNTYQDFNRDEITIPMIMIAQDGSPIAKKGHPEKVDGLEPGMWFNTLTKQPFDETGDTIEVIFIDSIVTRGIYTPAPDSKFIRALPEEKFLQIKHLLVRNDDKRGLEDQSGTVLSESEVVQDRYRCFCIMPSRPDLGMIVLYLKPGSFQALRGWKDAMKAKGLPHHKAVWSLPLVLDMNDKGQTWYNFGKGREFVGSFVRYVTKQEFDICEKLYAEFNRASAAAMAVPAGEEY